MAGREGRILVHQSGLLLMASSRWKSGILCCSRSQSALDNSEDPGSPQGLFRCSVTPFLMLLTGRGSDASHGYFLVDESCHLNVAVEVMRRVIAEECWGP